jgi:hypothetical protein
MLGEQKNCFASQVFISKLVNLPVGPESIAHGIKCTYTDCFRARALAKSMEHGLFDMSIATFARLIGI